MQRKRLRGSSRGITFTASSAVIGKKYRYIIDIEKRIVNIIPDENGNITASRKKSGRKVKPLFDLRSREVRDLIKDSSYMEVTEMDDSIIIHVYKQTVAKILPFRKKNATLSQFLGVPEGEIIISRKSLKTGTDGLETACLDWHTSSGDNVSGTELKRIYDVVSLFSGAGLFDKAWKESGRFRFVYANDFCRDVKDTYEYNIGCPLTCKDIRNVAADELPFSDIFLTSPCCQSFSNANRHNATSKEGKAKRLLVEEVVRLAKIRQPKVVVIENVPHMVTAENGKYISAVIDGLSGYEVTVRVVTDSDVGGYSNRRRCIVIASRIGKIELPDVKVLPVLTVRDALKGVDASWYNYQDVTIPSEQTKHKMSYVPQGGNWMNIPPEIGGYGPETQSNVMRRLSWNEPSITLSNFRKSNILHPEQNRILSVAEAAAIMGLDKTFHFISDSLSAKQQMVANGVTQAISRFVMYYVLKRLDAGEPALA